MQVCGKRKPSTRCLIDTLLGTRMPESAMPAVFHTHAPRLLLAGVLVLLGCVQLARLELAQLRDAFEVDARISHRLLSQRAVQLDAVLATLALLQPTADPTSHEAAAQRLPSVYPQILGVQRHTPGESWPSAALQAAEERSRQTHQPVLANPELGADRARFQLVLAAQPASYALLIDVHAAVPWSDWSMPVDTSPVRVTLEHAGQAFVVQPGRVGNSGWRFEFRKHLASDSQPFEVVAQRQVGWAELPWGAMLLWTLAVLVALLGWSAWQRQRNARLRAEALLQVGQVTRLNSLGVLAAGMAHELNQPLTAILANTQAAKRLLQDGPDELASAQGAMDQAVAQARRAAEVVARLRRSVEQPNPSERLQPLDLAQAVRAALQLLEPECQRHQVAFTLRAPQPVWVVAERVAVEQIVHNLVTNALQALAQVPVLQRQLILVVEAAQDHGVLRVQDTGPGIAPDALPHVFAPFFSTREGGLGLGLSLCETLANDMGGQLLAHAHAPQGAEFVLQLPLAPAPGVAP